jgi:hypothetical protein
MKVLKEATVSLSAQDIFEQLTKGFSVRYDLGIYETPEWAENCRQRDKLINHLNVIKSRNKKLLQELQFTGPEDFIIRDKINQDPIVGIQYSTIYAFKGQPERKVHSVKIITE